MPMNKTLVVVILFHQNALYCCHCFLLMTLTKDRPAHSWG
jgi:hypothetical protein